MTGAVPPRSRWLSAQALRLHATLLVVVCGCLAAGGFELSRALGGNELSWVYVFEWPFFAAFSARIWWRSLHEDEAARPTAAPAPSPGDAQLQAWQDYLARLHAEHPPGDPPGNR